MLLSRFVYKRERESKESAGDERMNENWLTDIICLVFAVVVISRYCCAIFCVGVGVRYGRTGNWEGNGSDSVAIFEDL